MLQSESNGKRERERSGTLARTEEIRNSYKIMLGIFKEKKPLEN
jgi:hypothetical protein